MFNTTTQARRSAMYFVVASSLSVGAVGFLDAAPASASSATTTRCTGTISGTSVHNVVVPAGATCTISNADVRGTIRIRQGAKLSSSHTLVRGSVALGRNASYDFQHVGIRGAVTAGRGSTVTARGGELFRGLRGTRVSRITMNGTVIHRGMTVTGWSASSPARVTLAEGAKVHGNTTLRNTLLYAYRARFMGSLNANGGNYQYVVKSTVNRNLTLKTTVRRGNLIVCGSFVKGDVTATSASSLRFGSNGSDTCRGNNVRGDVSLRARSGMVWYNTVRGDADGRFGRIAGGGNRVGGMVTGNFPG